MKNQYNILHPVIDDLEAHGLVRGSVWVGSTGEPMEVKHRWADPVTTVASEVVFANGRKSVAIRAAVALALVQEGRLRLSQKA